MTAIDTMMQQQIRHGLRVTVLADPAVGSAAATDAVAHFANAPTSAIPPAQNRGALSEWITVTQSATAGDTFKFTRKGIYDVQFVVPLVLAETTAVYAAIALDAPAAMLDATSATVAAGLKTVEDYDLKTGIADQAMSIKVQAPIHITNPLRASGAVGVLRILLSTGAGAAVTTASLAITQAMLNINEIAELFG